MCFHPAVTSDHSSNSLSHTVLFDLENTVNNADSYLEPWASMMGCMTQLQVTQLPSRDGFITAKRGLRHDHPAMRLWHKAKRFGVWDPQGIDFTQDAQDWARLNDLERRVLLHLASLFQAGEESVTLDLLPLIGVIAHENRLEEEMFLTSFLWEEAKHVETFDRFLREVAGSHEDFAHFHTPSYRAVFYEALPSALHRLSSDPSPVAQAEASVTYNLIVEGVLAETGYHAFGQMLERNKLMPGMVEAMGKLKQDESRHIAYGIFLLSRLIAEHGDLVWNAVESRMGELFPHAIGVVNEIFDQYTALPFGLEMDEFVNFAISQFQKRMDRVEHARGQTLEQVVGAFAEIA
jgi:ribonucleoside-diphosphate reductase beta chain